MLATILGGFALLVIAGCLMPVWKWMFVWIRSSMFLAGSPIPGPPKLDPLSGHAGALVSHSAHLKLAAWANEYGPVYKLQLLNRAAVVITDMDLVSKLLRKTLMPKPDEVYSSLELITWPPSSNMLTNRLSDAHWKVIRQGISACFSFTNLRTIFPRVLQLGQAAIQVVNVAAASRTEVDVADLAKRVTSDVMGSMLFNQDFGGMQMRPDPYLKLFGDMLDVMHKCFVNPVRNWMVWDRDVRKDWSILAEQDALLDDKLKQCLRASPPDHTIAGHLLKVRDPSTGKPLDPQRLKAELGVVLSAGFETTSHAITWTLAALATHPAVQQQLVDELAAARLALTVGPDGAPMTPRPVEWSDLAKLPYLNAVIKESLRLFTPVPLGATRLATADVDLKGHFVPKGTLLMFPSIAVSLAKHNYPSAMCFDPSRWLLVVCGSTAPSPTSSSADGPAAAPAAAALPPEAIPFGAGARDCVGQSLARLELQVVVATLVGHFHWSPGKTLKAQLARVLEEAAFRGLTPGEVPVMALLDEAVVKITLQPQEEMLLLLPRPRA